MAKRWIGLALIGIGFAACVFALGYYFYLQEVDQIGAAPLPDELAGQSLVDKIEGAPALDELTWLHRQEFNLNKGAVGTYGMQGEITLYIAGTPFGLMTGNLVDAMGDKIAAVDTPFTSVAEREIDRRRVYELIGMGQRHFYFRSGDLIVWLAADESLAEEALTQVLGFYP